LPPAEGPPDPCRRGASWSLSPIDAGCSTLGSGLFRGWQRSKLGEQVPFHPCLRLAHEGDEVDEELLKALAHAIPQQVSKPPPPPPPHSLGSI